MRLLSDYLVVFPTGAGRVEAVAMPAVLRVHANEITTQQRDRQFEIDMGEDRWIKTSATLRRRSQSHCHEPADHLIWPCSLPVIDGAVTLAIKLPRLM
jgi:hypothetical protein